LATVAIGADHRGYRLKQELIYKLKGEHTILDMGTDSDKPVDYPDFAKKVADAVAEGKADFGILICDTGIGMAIAANKVSGVRAAHCRVEREADMSRRHNNANIITIAGGYTPRDVALKLVKMFISTPFEGNTEEGERHKRRVEKIMKIEKEQCK